MVITNNKKPTTQTFGNIGDYYIDTDTNVMYRCVDTACPPIKYQFIDVNVDCCPEHIEYVWEECGGVAELTNCYMFFCEGARLDMVNNIDTSNATNFESMFGGCASLTTVPKLDTSNGTNFESMFDGCVSLTSIPELDTSNGTVFDWMFGGCSSLKAISKLDLSNGTNFDSMFDGCSALESIRLYNIRENIQIGSDEDGYGTLLDVDSLVHTIKELCKVNDTKTLTMSITSRDRISNLYCKVTDESTEKIEMELCNSTDSGTMTLSDYVALKNWTLSYI